MEELLKTVEKAIKDELNMVEYYEKEIARQKINQQEAKDKAVILQKQLDGLRQSTTPAQHKPLVEPTL